jgi:uncharacterized tellurite resistance protein B-like protein
VVPDVLKIVRAAQAAAGMSGTKVEVFIGEAPQMNASCMEVDGGFAFFYTAPLLERFTPGELAFVTGHELGHAAFGHLSLPASALLQLRLEPKLALALMAWNRRGELSCDRLGLLCGRSLQDAATALIKLSSGLSGSLLRFSLADYIAQMSELQQMAPSSDEAADWYASHPFSPLRVAALNDFWGSALAPPEAGDGPRHPVAELDRRVESLLRSMEPDATGAGPKQARDVLLWGGLLVVAADGKAHEKEKATLGQTVGPDALEAALKTLRATGNEAAAVAHIRKQVEAAGLACRSLPAPDRHALVQKLVAVARADNELSESELVALRTTAEAIGLSPGFVDKIISLFA